MTEFTTNHFTRVERVVETGSTNADLLERAKAGEAAGLALITDHQRSGRGRQGRQWHDRPGASMLMSVLVRPSSDAVERGDVGLIPLAAGLAVRAAVAGFGATTIGLKWPNDVLAMTERGERKLAGILAEATTTADGLAVVVGMGVNLDVGPIDERPDDVRERAVDVAELIDDPPDRDTLAAAVLEQLSVRLDQLDADRPALLHDYRGVCVSIGRVVSLDHPGGLLDGTITGIANDGSIVLETADGDRTLSAGEVHHRAT